MKGDKVVDVFQIISNNSLFLNGWKGYRCVSYKLFVKIINRATCGKHPILVKHLFRSKHVTQELQIKPALSISDEEPTVMNTSIYPHNIWFSETH